jgi:hypothetical protein
LVSYCQTEAATLWCVYGTFRNRDGKQKTIRADDKVIGETDTGRSKDDEKRWMRFTLDTVGVAGTTGS